MTERPISPIAAQKGEPVKASVKARCSCSNGEFLRMAEGGKPNPTCPVHGHGRPAGSGK
jgi:hypothetical protein